MNFSKIFLNLLLSLFGLFVALVFLEIAIRMLNLDRASLPTWEDRPSKYYHHEQAPDLRDWTHLEQKPDGVFRIAVVGDSFSFAPYMQANDTFAKKLEYLLNLNDQTQKVEVINYGVPRFSTSHEILSVKQAITAGADLILLQITLNDPEIKPYTPNALIADDRFGQIAPKGWVYQHWKTLSFIVKRLGNLSSAQKYRDYFFDLWNSKDTFGQFKDSLRSIVRISRKNKVPIVSVVFPLFGFPNDDSYPFHPIHQIIANELSSKKVPALDLFSEYKNIPLDRLVVLPARDRHPNEIAHRIAAEAIYEWLIQNKMVPANFEVKNSTPNRIGIFTKDNQEPLSLN